MAFRQKSLRPEEVLEDFCTDHDIKAMGEEG
jgi:hypothetical protein